MPHIGVKEKRQFFIIFNIVPLAIYVLGSNMLKHYDPIMEECSAPILQKHLHPNMTSLFPK